MTCCNHNRDHSQTNPARFEPCNDACAAGASCPPGGVCDRRHKERDAEPRFVYIPRWRDDRRNVVFAAVIAAVAVVAFFAVIAWVTR